MASIDIRTRQHLAIIPCGHQTGTPAFFCTRQPAIVDVRYRDNFRHSGGQSGFRIAGPHAARADQRELNAIVCR
jgi:hypothetical protein